MADILNTNFDSDAESEDFNPAQHVSDNDRSPSPDRRKPRKEKKQRSESPAESRNSSPARRSRSATAEDDASPPPTNRRGQASEDRARSRSASVDRRRRRRSPDEDEDMSEEEERPSKRKNRSDDEDEDDDEDDEEDEDDQGVRKHRHKKRRAANPFIEEEAEVDTDEEEEEDENDYDGDARDFIAEQHPDEEDEDLRAGRVNDNRHRELDRQRDREGDLDAEKQAELFRQRYGRRERVGAEAAYIPKRLLLPSVNDPSIWAIKCKPGKEREVVYALTKRIEERANSKMPVKVISAFERKESMPGYLYVEAINVTDVDAALDGLMNVYPRSVKYLVPITEMPDLLRTTKSKDLEVGQYVRVKRGLYANDLAQIIEIDNHGRDVMLRLVPRLDYGLNEDLNAPINGAQKRKPPGFGNSTVRPPARLFSEADAKKRHSRFLSRRPGGGWNYRNEDYVDDFLNKSFKAHQIEVNDVKPTLEEVTKFASRGENGVENLDLKSLATTLRDSTSNMRYVPGDVVEVWDSEQKGVWGRVENTANDIVTLIASDGEMKGQQIDVPVKNLRKKFAVGDHLRVTGASKYSDEVGMVTQIKEDKVTILTDNTLQEITVFSKDLVDAREFTAVSGDLDKVGKLIQLDPQTAGYIIRADRGGFGVLDQYGNVRTILASQASIELDNRRNAVATDRDGSEIHPGDTVREIGGERRNGRILYIYRSFAFCADPQDMHKDGGAFATRTSNLISISAQSGTRSNGTLDLTKPNPQTQRNMNAPPQVMKAPRFGRDKAIGEVVTIRKGGLKGLMGIVKDTTDEEADIELHSTGKVKRVHKDLLSFKQPNGGRLTYNEFVLSRSRGGRMAPPSSRMPTQSHSSFSSDYNSGSRTPMAANLSSRTPAWSQGGSRTPAWRPNAGSATPAYGAGSGGRTPAWSADAGNRTTNHYDGSRTAYGFSGSRTPAPGSATPAGGDAWSAGSKTPAYGWSAPTPRDSDRERGADIWAASAPTPKPFSGASGRSGYGADMNSAPTPGAGLLSAPTPGASHSHHLQNPNAAPTPGAHPGGRDNAWSAPTPGGWNAPTPGGYEPPTPGAAAATPGAWNNDNDDGPRWGTPSP